MVLMKRILCKKTLVVVVIVRVDGRVAYQTPCSLACVLHVREIPTDRFTSTLLRFLNWDQLTLVPHISPLFPLSYDCMRIPTSRRKFGAKYSKLFLRVPIWVVSPDLSPLLIKMIRNMYKRCLCYSYLGRSFTVCERFCWVGSVCRVLGSSLWPSFNNIACKFFILFR